MSPEGLKVSLSRLHITLPEALRFPGLIKLSTQGLSVSLGRIRHRNYAQDMPLKSSLRDLIKILVWGLDKILAREVLCLT